eukprot:scaffold5190_cov113-Isochrysis_galbana.AAC.7
MERNGGRRPTSRGDNTSKPHILENGLRRMRGVSRIHVSQPQPYSILAQVSYPPHAHCLAAVALSLLPLGDLMSELKG